MVSNNTDETSQLSALEQWRSMLFLVSGVLLGILALLWAVQVFTDLTVGGKRFFGPAGMTVAFVGLLGLYPTVADRTPWLARAGGLFAVIGLFGAGASAVIGASNYLGVIAARPAWAKFFELPLLVGIVFGFLTFGVASLWADEYSRAVGVLLSVPAILFPAVLVSVIVMGGDFPYVVHSLHNGTDALVLLGVGYLLRTKDVPTDRAEPAPDTTTR